MFGLKSKTLTGTGSVTSGPTRLVKLYLVGASSAGSVVLKNGGASGTTLFEMATPAGATLTQNIDFNDVGMRFESDCHATLTNITSITFLDG